MGMQTLVIVTESHRAHLLQKLRADAVEVDAAVEPGLLIVLDAADSLSKFTVATATDENRSAGMPYIIVGAVRRAEERHGAATQPSVLRLALNQGARERRLWFHPSASIQY